MRALVFNTKAKAQAAADNAWNAMRTGKPQNAKGELRGRNAATGELVDVGPTARWATPAQRFDTGEWWITLPPIDVNPDGVEAEVSTGWFAPLTLGD